MNLLSISQVSKTYDLKPVLRGVTLAVDGGERVGVIGANGAGKTTLFKLISGEIGADEGTISLRRGITTAMLAQQPQLDNNASVHDTLAASLIEVRQVINEYRSITERMAACQDEAELRQLEPEHAEIEHRLEQVGGWEYRHRIDAILGHLGIVDDSRLIGALSGGERKRVALACALIRNPDLLVLDEPTNHLDALTISWLEQYLDAYRGALLLITHDRYFLDNVVDRLIEIEGGRAINYQGGYSDYLATRAERQESEARAHARLLNMLRREEEWLRRGVRARGTKSKYRVQNVAELREAARREAVTRLETQLKTTKRLGNTILEARALTKAQGQRTLVKDLDFILVRGDRVALVGPNGCGKTTLLRVLMGVDAPTRGEITLGKNTHIAYFAQDRLDLDQELTVWEYISENSEMVNVRGEFRTVRSYLGDFKFTPDRLTVRIKTLSGGEKNRLVLAKILLTDANLLVLDEPTNDLDIETLQWIEQALVDFSGCVLFVSHDRFFLDKVANSLLVFEGAGQVVRHAGNYSLYQQLSAQSERAQAAPPEPKAEVRAPEKKTATRAKLSYKEQQELNSVEARLAELEQEIGVLERQLSAPGGADHQQIAALAERYEALKGESERMYERWLELEEKRGA